MPTVVLTGATRGIGQAAAVELARRGAELVGLFTGSPERGARSLVWLALDQAGGELRGQYAEKQRPVAPSVQAQDHRLAAALWERSEALTAARSA